MICFILLLLFTLRNGFASQIEDLFRTEIDLRDPNTFLKFRFKTLSVRQFGYSSVVCNVSGVLETKFKHDSFSMMRNYNYDERLEGMICPMNPMGIAAYCDWALTIPCLYAADPTKSPKTVFVHTLMLPHFVNYTLNAMDPSFRFVLVSAGVDMTVPSCNFGYGYILPGFSPSMDSYWGKLLKDPRIIHWFAEGHDLNHEKVSSLPTGLAYNPDFGPTIDDNPDYPAPGTTTSILSRPFKFVISDRVRAGTGAMTERAKIAGMCQTNPHCIHPPAANFSAKAGLPHKDFIDFLVQYPFIACVRGGGIDPSPKAWEAMLVGTIPIIQHGTIDDAYERLPVMFVDNMEELFAPNAEDLLKRWLTKLAPYYEEGSLLRKQTLHRLTSAYWIDVFNHKHHQYMVENKYPGYEPGGPLHNFRHTAAGNHSGSWVHGNHTLPIFKKQTSRV